MTLHPPSFSTRVYCSPRCGRHPWISFPRYGRGHGPRRCPRRTPSSPEQSASLSGIIAASELRGSVLLPEHYEVERLRFRRQACRPPVLSEKHIDCPCMKFHSYSFPSVYRRYIKVSRIGKTPRRYRSKAPISGFRPCGTRVPEKSEAYPSSPPASIQAEPAVSRKSRS